MLKGKKIVLGVTGSIAAFKAVDLASKLTQACAEVDVIMTRAAREFVTPLSFRSLTHRPVVTDMFDPASELSVEHVALAEKAEVIVVAPATADIIAKISCGIADEMLTSTILATKAPVVLAPAMNVNMWENQVTQDNLAKLRARGFVVVGPGYGRLACETIGSGRLAELQDILDTVSQVLGRKGDLAGRKIVVSAGGTQESIDPVRCVTNRSSGKMGYAIAEAARDRGAEVTLVSAAASLRAPMGIKLVPVETALQMHAATAQAVKGADALIMAAAVADYRPRAASERKIKKTAARLTIELVRNPDILSEVRGSFLRVGFAAESENLLENARDKLRRKKLDLIVANDITAPGAGFGEDTNKVVILDRKGRAEELPLLPKTEVAERLLDRVAALLPRKG
ncbi:MAG: bifunctional phosphopantothenoylcysteine decarboxylase/phosphopantothenate--cysteine ligase CoaBC [Dehalococcoidia bacterium]|nr:bifunctional phosphopantothenoylcysteine decarboxylase/phosphopantothenate--cysteine ligase CoaBC [Dehalococcoidia bacterium]